MSKKSTARGRTRRTVLQTLGAASVVGGTATARDGGPTLDERVEQSHRVLEATGSVEKQHEFLENRGVATAVDRGTMRIEKQRESEDDATTQRFFTEQISLSFSLYRDCNGTRTGDGTQIAEFVWEYDTTFNYGELPLDYVGIGWRDGSWDYETDNLDDLYSSDSGIEYIGGSSPEGPAWDFDERTLDPDGVHYAGVNVRWIGDETFEDTISASYTHTWQDVEVTGVSVSFPAGVSVSVASVDKKFAKDYNDDGDFLRLSYADTNSCPGAG